jgi:hypothetical protein
LVCTLLPRDRKHSNLRGEGHDKTAKLNTFLPQLITIVQSAVRIY